MLVLALTDDVVSRITGVMAGGLPTNQMHYDCLVVGDGREGSHVVHGVVEADTLQVFVHGVAGDVAVQFYDDSGAVDSVSERVLVAGVHSSIVLTHLAIRGNIPKKPKFEGHRKHVAAPQPGMYARRPSPKGRNLIPFMVHLVIIHVVTPLTTPQASHREGLEW